MSKRGLLLFLAAVLYEVQCAKILGIFPYPSKSHHILASALLKELANRGHEVTMISPYPFDKPMKNYHDVFLQDVLKDKEENMKQLANENNTVITNIVNIFHIIRNTSRSILEDQELAKFLETDPKFDVTIQLAGMSEALLGISHRVNSSTIGFSVVGATSFLFYLTGNPSPYAYIPHLFLPYTDDMNFLERTANTLVNILSDIYIYFIHIPYQKTLLREFFPEAPPLQDLIDQVDVTLVNSNYATETPRPYVPNVIQIGGFHLQEKEELGEELESFLDKSKNGVIYFSLGTNIKSSDLGEDKLQEILNSFSKLNQDILWKFETDLSNKPKNVKISNWLPQKAILGHPNVIAFITHGGLGSIVEAIYYGVPMICIPFIGDQEKNVADVVNNGFAIKLAQSEMTESKLTEAITEIANNPSYRRNIKLKSDLFRNQPMNPMNKAMFWIEHVIKHKGAKHLKSKATSLAWYQYMLLDVSAFIIFVTSSVSYLIYLMFKCLFKYCCARKRVVSALKKKQS